MDLVPTIDIAEPSAASLSALDAACADHGFFLLEGHGLDDLIDQTWHATHQFFDSPPEVKESIRRNPDSMLGWFDRELTKRKRDHKEVFDFIDPEIPPRAQPELLATRGRRFPRDDGAILRCFRCARVEDTRLATSHFGSAPRGGTEPHEHAFHQHRASQLLPGRGSCPGDGSAKA